MEEFCQRQGGEKFERPRALLARDADRLTVGGFGGDRIAPGENIGAKPVKMRLQYAHFLLCGDFLRPRDQGQRFLDVTHGRFELSQVGKRPNVPCPRPGFPRHAPRFAGYLCGRLRVRQPSDRPPPKQFRSHIKSADRVCADDIRQRIGDVEHGLRAVSEETH